MILPETRRRAVSPWNIVLRSLSALTMRSRLHGDATNTDWDMYALEQSIIGKD